MTATQLWSAMELSDAVTGLTDNEDTFVPVVLIAGHRPEILAIRRITFDGNRSQLIIETKGDE